MTGASPSTGFEQKPNVVPEVVAAEHLADEPSGRIVEDRQAVRALPPCAPRELVRAITGLAAEQSRQVAMSPRQQMDGQMRRPLRDPKRVIAF